MNKIEELIQKLCPEGVAFKELQEVVILTMGTSPAGNTFSPNPENGIEFHQGKTSFGNEIINHSNIYTTRPIKIAEPDSLIMSVRAPVGATNLTNRRIAIGRGLCSMIGKNGLITKFLYYFINDNIQAFKDKSNGSTFEAINTNDIKQILIPVPPLPIQQEIVNILDKFTELTAELEAKLTAELEARKKQYEYYRNNLLTPVEVNGRWMMNGKEVEWKSLGEIGEFIRGNGLQKKDFTETGVGCIHYGQIYTYYGTFAYKTKSFVSNELAEKLQKVNTGDLIITNTSENIEDVCKTVAWLGKDEIVTGGHATIFKHRENSKYLVYCTQTSMFFSEKKNLAKGTKVIDVSAKDLAKIRIPIPPLAEQERIVAILEKFDALVNDISSGIPAEIAARRKQYEYYRSKLLSFKEKP